MLALDMTLHTGWFDGGPASLAYDDLAYSLVYKELLEYIHRAVLRVGIFSTQIGQSQSHVCPWMSKFYFQNEAVPLSQGIKSKPEVLSLGMAYWP